MSADSQTAADFRVKYSRRIDGDGREQKHSEVEMLDDEEQHPDVGLQAAVELNTQKKISAVKRRCFRAFGVNLGLLYLLILAGITTRCILVTLEKQQLQEEVKELKDKMEEKCREGWMRFGCSCYFKSTERKTWSESRRDCQDKGADLVMINSKEEQEFINELNMRGESWIGLERYSQKHEWKWVDGSLLTEMFWAPGKQSDSLVYYAACCDSDGRWTQSYDPESKTFICEK
uniref:C-type lectin domain-containing protein n=1 Tax=Oreochromis niloticus TaxID=8128 RepID=A0A669DUZ1_ORENI